MFPIGSAVYPWARDPLITDAWIADARWLDSTGSVGIWSPCKGNIQLVQATGANKPAYSAAWGTGNHGMLTFNGTSGIMRGNALAAKVAGTSQAFTVISSFQPLSLPPNSTTFGDVLNFSASSNTANFCILGQLAKVSTFAPGYYWSITDSSGGYTLIGAGTGGVTATTSKIVVTCLIAAGTISVRINGGAVASGGFPHTTFSPTKFTIGGVDAATIGNYQNMNQRAIIFAPSKLQPASYVSIENYLIADAD